MNNLPHHVAIIPDGNRRWAKTHHLPSFEGHRRGFNRAVEICRLGRRLGIHTMTLWGFSTENWQRSLKEISYLMKLYERMIASYLKDAHKDQVRLIHLGREDRLPQSLLAKINQAAQETSHYKRHVLNIALDYGGRDEILRAIKQAQGLKLKAQRLTEDNFNQFLDTANQPYPEPDLIIRTSGEQRISGLFLWQAAYAEYYFEPCHFPDFTPEKFKKSIEEYSQRQRRFGK